MEVVMDKSNDLGLQPIGNHGDKALVDVVFVHGLGGNAETTWGTKPCWPKKLAEDHTQARVWTYGHLAPRFNLSDASGVKKELQDTATQLLEALKVNEVGIKLPLIFVVHSLGGLIVKAALRQDQKSSKIGNPDYRQGTRAVVFIATPHYGSSLANFAAVFPEIVSGAVGLVTKFLGLVPYIGLPIKAALQRSKLVGQLERDDAPLRELANWYRTWAQTNSVVTRAYWETERFKGVHVVVPSSADPGVSGCDPVAVDGANHVTIATLEKVDLTRHPVYLGVKHVVSEVMSMAKGGREESLFQQRQVFQEVLKATRDSNQKFEGICFPLDKQLEKIPREDNIRIEFITKLVDLLEEKCRGGELKLSTVEEGAARDSTYAIDRLVLYVWLEHKARLVVSEVRESILSEIKYFNSESNESLSLIPLNRSVQSFHGAILEDMHKLIDGLGDARRKILVRRKREMEMKIEEDYKADGNGATRRLLSKMLCELKAMSEARDEFRKRKGGEPDYDGGL
jgi:alpha-beta hydrolase superfamily lysophospholipase